MGQTEAYDMVNKLINDIELQILHLRKIAFTTQFDRNIIIDLLDHTRMEIQKAYQAIAASVQDGLNCRTCAVCSWWTSNKECCTHPESTAKNLKWCAPGNHCELWELDSVEYTPHGYLSHPWTPSQKVLRKMILEFDSRGFTWDWLNDAKIMANIMSEPDRIGQMHHNCQHCTHLNRGIGSCFNVPTLSDSTTANFPMTDGTNCSHFRLQRRDNPNV